MFFPILLHSKDPNLGRLDYSLLSDQALMEMLIDRFDDESKEEMQDVNGMYLDVCEWECVKCDGDRRVIEIDIDSSDVSGSLELFYVPPKVNEIYVRSMFNSKLTGSVDLTRLPVGVNVLAFTDCRLTGKIDLTQLPNEMQFLDLQNNQLTGNIDLTRLPDEMRYMNLRENKLTGKIDLTQLPCGMQKLLLHNNQLSGPLVLKRLPPGMFINVQGNNFNSVAVVDSEVHADINLQGSGVTSVVDKNSGKLDCQQLLK